VTEIAPDSTIEDPAATATTKSARKSTRHHLIEWGVILVIALVVSMGLRAVAFQTFFIPSVSMQPTLQVGDRIIVDKLAVRFGTIHRGDVLVFKAPPAENCGGEPVSDLVKRVIGIPGDHLYSVGNTIYVNGTKLKEAWPHIEPLGTPIATANNPIVVEPNHYFMMGDNHPDSCDSRYWGTIPRSDIIGKAFVRIWPISRIGSL
jgi:signal peptidase I